MTEVFQPIPKKSPYHIAFKRTPDEDRRETRSLGEEAEPQQLSELLSLSMSTSTLHADVPSLDPPGHARTSHYDTTVSVPRYRAETSLLQRYSDNSPYTSSPSTAVNSRCPSPTRQLGDEEASMASRRVLKWRIASAFFACFTSGWADGVTGTVMPYLSSQFHLTSTMTSSLFAASTCGFFAGTLLIEPLLSVMGRTCIKTAACTQDRFFSGLSQKSGEGGVVYHSPTQGRFLLILFASLLYTTYFILMGSQQGFALMFLAYALSAFSRSLLTASLNVFLADGPKQSLGYGLGLIGLGSVISPLVCQSIIATGVPWYRFYYGSLVLAGINILFLSATFRPTASELSVERSQALLSRRFRAGGKTPDSGRSSPVSPERPGKCVADTNATGDGSTLKKALKMPYQWAFSAFVLLYCGSETTTQGFMVTYLLSTRNANPRTVGYVTSGFWGGISVGRFIWGYLIPLLSFTQRKHAIHACIGVAVVLHLLIWFVRSTIQNAISASLIGMLYGPIFPACLSMANDILPPEVHMVAMALISSFASLGGAVFPLMTGAVLDAKGNQSLTYVTVPLAITMGCLWTFFPSRLPRQRTATGSSV